MHAASSGSCWRRVRKMNDKKLGSAVAQVCEEKLLTQGSALPADFKFSESFEIKMRSIIGKDRKPCVRKRIKTVFIIAAMLAAGSCLAMRAEPDWNYIVKDCTCGKNVSFDVSAVSSTKGSVEQTYEIGPLPERYTLCYENISRDSVSQLWGIYSEETHTSSDSIYFGQYIPSIYQDVQFSDKAGYYFGEDGTQDYTDETDDGAAVVWFKDGYVFLLSGSLNKDEMLRLCKTLKISEKQPACLID